MGLLYAPCYKRMYGRRCGRGASVDTVIYDGYTSTSGDYVFPLSKIHDKDGAAFFVQQVFDVFRSGREVCCEIGFGYGDYLFKLALANPDVIFIGFESYFPGIMSIYKMLNDTPLGNIYIYPGNVWDVLGLFPDRCILNLFMLYPDPWPRLRHHKRRMINSESLSIFSSKLTDNGLILFLSDITSYVNSIHELCMDIEDFILLEHCNRLSSMFFSDTACRFEGFSYPEFYGTKFSLKADLAMRSSMSVVCRKCV